MALHIQKNEDNRMYHHSTNDVYVFFITLLV